MFNKRRKILPYVRSFRLYPNKDQEKLLNYKMGLESLIWNNLIDIINIDVFGTITPDIGNEEWAQRICEKFVYGNRSTWKLLPKVCESIEGINDHLLKESIDSVNTKLMGSIQSLSTRSKNIQDKRLPLIEKLNKKIDEMRQDGSSNSYIKRFKTKEMKKIYLMRDNVGIVNKKLISEYNIIEYRRSGFLFNKESIVFSRLGEIHCHIDCNIKKHLGKYYHIDKYGNENLVKQVTIMRTKTGKWFAKVSMDQIIPEKLTFNDKLKVIGIDLGIDKTIYDSDGNTDKDIADKVGFGTFLSKKWDTYKAKKKKLNQKMSAQMVKLKIDNNEIWVPFYEYQQKYKNIKIIDYSNNYKKTLLKLRRINEYLNNVRSENAHQIGNYYVNNYDVIGFEDLNVIQMINSNRPRQPFKYRKSNSTLRGHINNTAFKQIVDVTIDKGKRCGCLVKAVEPRNTSRICSNCGERNEITLKDRIFECKKCGFRLERDFNAAINIRNRTINYFNAVNKKK